MCALRNKTTAAIQSRSTDRNASSWTRRARILRQSAFVSTTSEMDAIDSADSSEDVKLSTNKSKVNNHVGCFVVKFSLPNADNEHKQRPISDWLMHHHLASDSVSTAHVNSYPQSPVSSAWAR